MAVPCRVCTASVQDHNLERHLAKVHPGVAVPTTTSWRGRGAVLGWLPGRVAVEDGAVRASWALGLRRRRVALAGASTVVLVGGLTRARIAAGMTSYADDFNVPTESVRAGTYLRLGRLTIGCPRSTDLKSHWRGWTQGPKRGRWNVTLDPVSFVGLQYALADAGVLAPRAAG